MEDKTENCILLAPVSCAVSNVKHLVNWMMIPSVTAFDPDSDLEYVHCYLKLG